MNGGGDDRKDAWTKGVGKLVVGGGRGGEAKGEVSKKSDFKFRDNNKKVKK